MRGHSLGYGKVIHESAADALWTQVFWVEKKTMLEIDTKRKSQNAT